MDTVRRGLAAWRASVDFSSQDGILVCPADHPAISANDIGECVAKFRATASRIVVASYAGERGHPLIFPVNLASYVDSTACDGGLNRLGRDHAEIVTIVPCRSAAVTHDLDTPGDVAGTWGGK